VPLAEIDVQYPSWDEWRRIRSTLLPGDQIWPFLFNRNTLAMPSGYVIIRDGKPIDALITLVS
jgi:hypothetical protein